MVEHLVLFRRKENAKPELEQRLIAALRGLRDKVPGIVELSCGANLTPERGQGYMVGLRVLFDDWAALSKYGPHPEHLAIMPLILEYSSDRVVVDMEV